MSLLKIYVIINKDKQTQGFRYAKRINSSPV